MYLKEETLKQKEAAVAEIKDLIDNANSMVILRYQGVSVADITELRAECRKEDVNYKVLKNTMVRRALHELNHEELDDLLNGPNAFVFSNGDMTAGPRIVGKYAKSHEDNMEIKAGLVDGNIINASEVNRLATLPPKDQLLSMVLRAMQGPVAGLAMVGNAILSKLVYALNAIKEKEENEAA